MGFSGQCACPPRSAPTLEEFDVDTDVSPLQINIEFDVRTVVSSFVVKNPSGVDVVSTITPGIPASSFVATFNPLVTGTYTFNIAWRLQSNFQASNVATFTSHIETSS